MHELVSVPSKAVSIDEAVRLMMGFAERTGLSSVRPPRRYLWTDAFAVCNFVGLARATGEGRYIELALRLIEQVHHVLGRHRDDDVRQGWLSGLDADEGESHPTLGGLRIGKTLPERRPEEPFDDRLEWDRDGQYFHYLTKWMYALDQTARATRRYDLNLWARELGETASRAFCWGPRRTSGRRLKWKMSIDLSRALVPSMGQHDPLDGFITYAQLAATTRQPVPSPGPDLREAITDFAAMVEGRDWLTLDPLGLGGLLTDAYRVEQLIAQRTLARADLFETLLVAALEGLSVYARQGDLQQPASRRLAFRELGLAIGLQAVNLMGADPTRQSGRASNTASIHAGVQELAPYLALGSTIEACWLDPRQREARTWTEHADINDVMLATSLVPEGFLVIPPLD